MTSISNAVYSFVQAKVTAATIAASTGAGTPLSHCGVNPNFYDPIDKTNVLRVGDVFGSKPLPLGNGTIREFDAGIVVQAIAKPATAANADLLVAREKTTAMMLELVRLIYLDDSLGNTVCQTIVVDKTDGWGNYAGTRHAVSEIELLINPKR